MGSESSTESKDRSVLIVGAGTIGLSTAFHLTERGYTNITVHDCGENVPSAFSAGNDVNKIVRADYEDECPYYRHVGYLVTSTSSAPQKATTHITHLINALKSNPQYPQDCLHILPSSTAVKTAAPHLTGPLEGWSGYVNTHAGYARAAPALKAVYNELLQRGVKFRLGEAGRAVKILPDSETATIFPAARPYVRTADGGVHCADVVILALGAHTGRVLPEAGKQLTAKSWAVGHVRISAGEAKRLMGVPVVNCRDLGFFSEPVKVKAKEGGQDEWWIKLCAHGGGYTNNKGATGSLPPEESGENEGIPRTDETLIRRLLEHALPEFAKRPLVKRFMCWCADTTDSEYVIDYVPGYAGLALAGGDSGHAFKMFPIFGEWVADLVEKGQQEVRRWTWKERDSDGKEDTDWRVGNVRDLSEVERWKDGCDDGVETARSKL